MNQRPRHHHRPDRSSEPLHRSPLPPDLAEFLRTQDRACLFWGTDKGTVLIAKLPRTDIASARGTVPIQIRHELYEHPAAPVIRTVTTIYDRPSSPIRLETFTNAADPQQRSDFAALATQDHLYLLFYDERLRHRLTKGVDAPDPSATSIVLSQPERLYQSIPAEVADSDLAKAAVLRSVSL